jgi:hypothetical protein
MKKPIAWEDDRSEGRDYYADAITARLNHSAVLERFLHQVADDIVLDHQLPHDF